MKSQKETKQRITEDHGKFFVEESKNDFKTYKSIGVAPTMEDAKMIIATGDMFAYAVYKK